MKQVEIYDYADQIKRRKSELLQVGFELVDNHKQMLKFEDTEIILVHRASMIQKLRSIGHAEKIYFYCGYYEPEYQEALNRVLPVDGKIYHFGFEIFPKKVKVEL